MLVNGDVLAGACCAAFIGGMLLCAAVAFLWLHLYRQTPQGQHNASSTLPSTPSITLRPPPSMNRWLPQPAGFDANEHKMMTLVEPRVVQLRCLQLQSDIKSFVSHAQWKELPANTLRALGNDSFAAILTRHNYGYTSVSTHTSLPLPLSSTSNPSSIPAWSAVANLVSRPETRKSALTHLLSRLIFSNISLDGSGPAEWNLLSPHLAGLAQEIAELQKIRKESSGSFSVWSWEKLRVYALNNLYPSIFPTSGIESQNKQPTTQPYAISRLEKLLVDLLSPYIEITDDDMKTLQYLLQIAGRLGVFFHKDLRPLGWSWETDREGITLFPALELVGSKSGIRDPSEACQIIELQLDPDYNLAGEFLGGRKGQDLHHG